jgi:hypothetical protein
MQDLETEYAVSPNTPLLSTEVQENVWVCGERRAHQACSPAPRGHRVPRD